MDDEPVTASHRGGLARPGRGSAWYNLRELSSTTATGRLAARSTVARVGQSSSALLAPLAVPSLLMLAGALVGYACTLDRSIATERLVGLLGATLLAMLAVLLLRRAEQPAPLLLGVALVSLLGGVWTISAAGPDVFRGAVGSILLAFFRPVLGLAKLTDPVDVTNTRFIVGYNGLADLCLVTIFCCAAIWRSSRLAIGLLLVGLVLLVGTGARGGLTGLAAGVCAIGVFAWPRRYAVLGLVAAPVAIVVAAAGVLDKGLEFSSTAGRLTYWGDLARLLVEYPLTGVGLGVDTANRVSLRYEINPDPDRIFYAHNTFVQTYLEQGPLGTLGMLLLPGLALAAALSARRQGTSGRRRTLLLAGLGVVGGLEAHGLTDQVVTTNVGSGLVLLGLAAIVAALQPASLATLGRLVRWACLGVLGLAALAGLAILALPAARAQALLDVGSLQSNRALLALDAQSPERPGRLADAERTLSLALAQDPGQPAVLRELARVRSARFDDSGAFAALRAAAASNRLDAFDRLQIAHVYRDLGLADDAYAWAAQAYAAWGRPPEDAVMQVYAQSTLTDERARTLATQAEAAMRARHFAEARSLFEQALTFQPGNAYLDDRVGAAQRAVDRYGG